MCESKPFQETRCARAAGLCTPSLIMNGYQEIAHYSYSILETTTFEEENFCVGLTLNVVLNITHFSWPVKMSDYNQFERSFILL